MIDESPVKTEEEYEYVEEDEEEEDDTEADKPQNKVFDSGRVQAFNPNEFMDSDREPNQININIKKN